MNKFTGLNNTGHAAISLALLTLLAWQSLPAGAQAVADLPPNDVRGPWRIEGTGESVSITGPDNAPAGGPRPLDLHTDKRNWTGAYYPDPANDRLPPDQPRMVFRYKPRPEEMNPEMPRAVRQKISGQLEWKIEIFRDPDSDTTALIGKWYPGAVRWTDTGDAVEATIAGGGKPRAFRLVPGASILDSIEEAERNRPLTPAEMRRREEQAAREGVAEGNEAEDWERAAAAAMAGDPPPDHVTGPDGRTPEQAEEIRRIQAARVAARETARQERLAQADRDSLKARRTNAERDLQRYEEMLDRKLKAEGRSQLTEDEYIERDRREARFLELMQLTPEEAAEVDRQAAIGQQVNAEINRSADNMGGTSEEEIAERARNAAMVDAGTKTWRDFTFTGRMVSEVEQDIFRQREMGIRNNNEVMAAQNYLKRTDLTPEQRAAAEQYLARSVQQRGHNAEAILYDGAVVITGVAADVGMMGVGGTVSRGVSKIFGTEAAAAGAGAGTQAGRAVAPEVAAPAARTAAAETAAATRASETSASTQAGTSASSAAPNSSAAANAAQNSFRSAETQVVTEAESHAASQAAAAAAEDLTATQLLPNAGRTAADAAGATTRVTGPQAAAAAAEDLTATQLLPNAGRTAADAAGATTRVTGPQAAAAAAEDLTATQLLPNAGRTAADAAGATTRVTGPQAAAATAEELAATQAVPNGAGAANAAQTSFRSAETQVAMESGSQSAAGVVDEAALQAQNLAREAELARQVAQRAREAEQAVQKAAQEGRELTAAEAARYHSDIVARQYNQQMNALAQQAREAGVAESKIQQLTQDAFGASPKRGATVAMQNLVEETARARGYTIVASEQAEPVMHAITNIRSGSAGVAEAEVLRRNINEAAARGANYFDELARQGTSTMDDGFQAIADDLEIEALRQFARSQGLIK